MVVHLQKLARRMLADYDARTPGQLRIGQAGAASLIGASAVKVELPPKREGFPLASPFGPEGGWASSILPYIDPKAAAKLKKDAPTEKSQVALRLEKLKVEEGLRKLRDDDPDRSVREAASMALKQLASVKEKKP